MLGGQVQSVTARKAKKYTSGATPNLVTDGGAPCWGIIPLADGALTLTQIDGVSTGSLSVLGGVALPIQANAVSASSCDFLVFWL